MRGDLNEILDFIGAESLTDLEWNPIADSDLEELIDQYNALKDVMIDREAVSSMRERLKDYFRAKGVNFPDEDDDGPSNIFVGAGLCGD